MKTENKERKESERERENKRREKRGRHKMGRTFSLRQTDRSIEVKIDGLIFFLDRIDNGGFDILKYMSYLGIGGLVQVPTKPCYQLQNSQHTKSCIQTKLAHIT